MNSIIETTHKGIILLNYDLYHKAFVSDFVNVIKAIDTLLLLKPQK